LSLFSSFSILGSHNFTISFSLISTFFFSFKKIKKIAALSDIHGQYDLAIELLKNNKIIAIMMTLSMLAAAFAGCLSDDDESNFDEADGGYEYASNVDNHRMLVEDVCDIKDLAEAHD